MKKYTINKALVIQKFERKTTIFSGESSQLISLNETATFIFQQLRKGKDENTTVKSLMEKYDISENEARDDIKKTIEELIKLKIILI